MSKMKGIFDQVTNRIYNEEKDKERAASGDAEARMRVEVCMPFMKVLNDSVQKANEVLNKKGLDKKNVVSKASEKETKH